MLILKVQIQDFQLSRLFASKVYFLPAPTKVQGYRSRKGNVY